MDEHIKINGETRWGLELDKAQGVKNTEDGYKKYERLKLGAIDVEDMDMNHEWTTTYLDTFTSTLLNWKKCFNNTRP